MRSLIMTDNNISAAAKLLGITRPTFYDLIKKYDIPVAHNQSNQDND
jgi:two-component system NtrC family response regulator